MRKKLLYIILGLLSLTSCEEYYEPAIDAGTSVLVVESLLTNDQAQNFVKLSYSSSFYNSKIAMQVSGASTEIINEKNESFPGTETNDGYFLFDFSPVSGEKYKLRITLDSEIYESDFEMMPSLPSLDSVYSEPKTKYIYQRNNSGAPTVISMEGREIRVDATATEQKAYYLFTRRTITETLEEPSFYVWHSSYSTGAFNTAGSKVYGNSTKVEKHPITFFGTTGGMPVGWILFINQYSITRNAYDFMQQVNDQLAAEGRLFDPLYTQITGNIKCISDSSKAVVGLFDLRSYKQYRYFFKFYQYEQKMYQHQIETFYDIPDSGKVEAPQPEFWEEPKK